MNKVIARIVLVILSLISVFALSSCNGDDQAISKTDDVESASYSKMEIDENMKMKLEFDGNEIEIISKLPLRAKQEHRSGVHS